MVYKALLWDKSYELRAGFRIGILLLNRNYIFVFQEGFPGFHVVIHGYNNSACFSVELFYLDCGGITVCVVEDALVVFGETQLYK